MKKSKNLLLLTKDTNFSEMIQNRANIFNTSKTHELNIIEVDSKYKLMLNINEVSVVLIDFSTVSTRSDVYATLLEFRKKTISPYIPIISVWSSKAQLKENERAFYHGFCYAYIREEDDGKFMDNVIFLTFGDDNFFQAYALVNIVGLPTTLKGTSICSSIDHQSICVESSTPLKDGVDIRLISETFPLIDGVKCNVLESSEDATLYDFYARYKLGFEFNEKASEEDQRVFAEDDLLIWLDDNSDQFLQKSKSFLVFSDNEQLDTASLYDTKGAFFIRRKSLDNMEVLIEKSKFQFIFFDMNESNPVIEKLGELIRIIKSSEGYKPTLCFFNIKSSSSALSVAYSYQRILGAKEKLSIKMLKSMLEKALSVPPLELDSGEMLLYKSKEGELNTLEVEFEVEVDSFSENIFSFYSDSELKMYSMFKISCPREFHVTIVPLSQQVLRKGKYLYMGFLHGGDYFDFKALRCFVNQAIFNPLTEFKIGEDFDEINDLNNESEITEDLQAEI